MLENEKEISESIRHNINDSELRELRKRELKYKLWHTNVYEPIQKEVYKNVNGESAEYARYIRNLRYLEFLHHTNKRGGVCQDDFEPEEYNPVDLVNLDATLNRLKDPTHLRQRKDHDEQNVIYKCMFGKDFTAKEINKTKLPVIMNDNESRKNIDWNRYLIMHHSAIESPARVKSS